MTDTKQILVLATHNQGKLREIVDLLAPFPVALKSLDDFGPIPLIEEDGKTFDDNAYKDFINEWQTLLTKYFGIN